MLIQEKNIQRLLLEDLQDSSFLFTGRIKELMSRYPDVVSMMTRFPFMLGIVGPEGDFLYVNGHCLEHFPVNKRNAPDINAYDAYQEMPAFVFSIRQAMRGVERKEVVPVTNKDVVGWFFPLHENTTALSPVVAIIFQTQTQQVVTEKDLQFYRSHFAKAQQIGKIGLWEWDLKTDLVYWSSETYRLYGFDNFQFEPNINNALEFVHPEDSPRVVSAINQGLTELKGYDVEFRVILYNDEIRFQRVNAELILDEEGEVIRVLGSVQDIKDNKQAEMRLERTNQRIYTILENIPNAFVSVDSNWRITYANKIIEKLLKIPRRLLVGQKLWNVFPEDVSEECKKVFSDPETRHQKLEVLFNNLQSWFEVSVNEGPEGYLVFFNEVTKHKTLENTLRDLNEAKNQFFSIIAHDLKSPFNSIMGLTELLATAPDSISPEELKAIMDRLGKTTRNVYKMLENLLIWSKNQMNQLEMDPGEYDLKEIVDFNRELFAPKADQKGISISSNISQPVTFHGDKNIVDTIVRNLMSNSLKFTPKEGNIHWEVEETEMEVIAKIADTGPGMDKGVIDLIFNKNETYTSEGTEGEKGTGLGLKLCRDLVEKCGGKMWVISEPSGTTFCFSLLKPGCA